jgi:oxygen-independent coproporphyrinogen-3 oxidase
MMATDTTKTEIGSYFISNYPPFSVWSREEVAEVERALSEPPADVPLGLYLHIPFCRKRCKFCYFKVFTDNKASDIDRYMAALSHEIEIVSKQPVIGGRPFRFVYFGGGTPSYLSVKQLNRLTDWLHQSIRWDEAEEVTFECEPGTLSQPKVQAIRDLGVTRLSLGIENFDDTVLAENGRAHLSGEVYKAWEWIQDVGFPIVNVDLISGMVGETEQNWQENIRRVLELKPDAVTIYQMELPFNTVYSSDVLGDKIEMPVADWPTKRRWVSEAFDALAAAGYATSSAYTMVRDPNKVNFSYRDNLWHGSDLIATGIASFGHISGVHYQNLPEWGDYLNAIEEDHRLPLGRALRPTSHQMLVRELILLLKRGYLDAGYFRKKYNVDIFTEWRERWQTLEGDGMLTISGDRVELTRDGYLQVDGLLPNFFEAEHQGIRYT